MNTTTELTELTMRAPLTEKEYIAANQLEIARLKEKDKMSPTPICVGIVCEIKPVASKFGFSFAIKMDHQSYFYNGMTQNYVHELFVVGKKVAFSYKEKKTGDKVFKVIENIFQCF